MSAKQRFQCQRETRRRDGCRRTFAELEQRVPRLPKDSDSGTCAGKRHTSRRETRVIFSREAGCVRVRESLLVVLLLNHRGKHRRFGRNGARRTAHTRTDGQEERPSLCLLHATLVCCLQLPHTCTSLGWMFENKRSSPVASTSAPTCIPHPPSLLLLSIRAPTLAPKQTSAAVERFGCKRSPLSGDGKDLISAADKSVLPSQ